VAASPCAITATRAIDYFGRQYGLPPVITGHQNYWLWGPHNYTGQCMVILGRTRQELESNRTPASRSLGRGPSHPYAIRSRIIAKLDLPRPQVRHSATSL